MDNNDDQTTVPRRLCSEIQLFDLCDLEQCRFKEGKFCTEPTLLRKFEAISDDEEEGRSPAQRSGSTAEDDDEEWFDGGGDEEEDEDSDYSVFDDEDGEEREVW
ncbi:hypothetical protein [Trichlorobacter ammonificans]|uniref:hypothetical protein n=1 Tax=Trichlorobacter ammonificans TaxID=2916410 RepID=UPI002737B2EA|nr:hypothetical protein [Trichlorobacter ammonificans]